MEIRSLEDAVAFITADGSTIREILGNVTAPVRNQSLAEATIGVGQATMRHYHRVAEEIYFMLEGAGEIEIDGERAPVRPGDGILIPPGSWHELRNTGEVPIRLLCSCAPAYLHSDTFFE